MSCGFETLLANMTTDDIHKYWSFKIDEYINSLFSDDGSSRILQMIIFEFSRKPIGKPINFSITVSSNSTFKEWIYSANEKLHDNKFLSKYYTINIYTNILKTYGSTQNIKFTILLSYKIPRMYIVLEGTKDKHTGSPILRMTQSALYDRQIWRVINKLVPNIPELPR